MKLLMVLSSFSTFTRNLAIYQEIISTGFRVLQCSNTKHTSLIWCLWRKSFSRASNSPSREYFLAKISFFDSFKFWNSVPDAFYSPRLNYFDSKAKIISASCKWKETRCTITMSKANDRLVVLEWRDEFISLYSFPILATGYRK